MFLKRNEVRFRVRYAETDQMGVVYHANYLVWMEIGRTEMCRDLGFVYSDMEANDGVLLVVAEANCRYLRPARYDDEVVVETGLGLASSRMVRFDYSISSVDGQALCTGFTKHIFCDRELRPAKLPTKYFPLFGL